MRERAAAIVERLRAAGSEANRAGMARYGINVARALGVTVAHLRAAKKEIGTDQALAEALWDTGVHEARILACFVADPARMAEDTLEAWTGDLDSWDLTDQFTNNLARRTAHARALAAGWAARPEPFVKRAGLTLMASLAVHDKAAPEAVFSDFLATVAAVADDGRTPVKKAVSWALRQIGKRSPGLQAAAVETAERILESGGREGRWAARDALRELNDPKTTARIAAKAAVTSATRARRSA